MQHLPPQLQILGPGEALLSTDLRIPIPGIAAENFIGALSGQGNLHMGSDFPAEGQQRKIHIRHTGKIPGKGCVLQGTNQILRSQNRSVMVRLDRILHDLNIFSIRIGLELSRFEIAVIICIVNGKGMKLFSPLSHFSCADSADDAGIQSSGEECTQWIVRNHLPFDGIGQKISNLIAGIFKAFPMLPIRKLPVAAERQFTPFIPAAAAGLHLLNPPKHTAAGKSSRAQHDDFGSPLGIQLRFYRRMGQNGLDFRGEKQTIPPLCIKKRLYPDPVPSKKQLFCLCKIHPKGKNPVQPLQHLLSPLGKAVQQHFRIGMGVKYVTKAHQL